MAWKQPGPVLKAGTMTIIDELITLVENLDEDGHDYRDVRAIKRIAHNLAKIAENLKASA
jgi:hypothetical protein